MTLSIVIVSYNTKSILLDCLESLYVSLEYTGLLNKSEIIIVDNASTDGTTSKIQSKYPKIVLIQNKENAGFGQANNQGIKKAKGIYTLLLNSDTKLFKDTIKKSLLEIESTHIDVLGPKLLNKDGTIQQSAGYFPTPIRVIFWMFFLDSLSIIKDFIKPYHVKESSFYENKHDVDWVTGAYFLAKREVFENTLFDPHVFMYVEEVELCYRIKKNAKQIIYSPKVSLIHFKGGSSDKGVDAGIIEELNGIKYYYKTHYGWFAYNTIRLILFSGALLRLLIFAIIKPSERKKEYYKAYLKLA